MPAVLATARARYPKAWLAVGDDATLNAVGSPDAVASVPATRPGGNATLMPADLERTLKQAREAFRRKDYATAIPLLTRLMEQPEFPQRAKRWNCWASRGSATASWRMPRRNAKSTCAATRRAKPRTGSASACAH